MIFGLSRIKGPVCARERGLRGVREESVREFFEDGVVWKREFIHEAFMCVSMDDGAVYEEFKGAKF